MDRVIFGAFRDILSSLHIVGPVLEIGAVPSADSLLSIDLLEGLERVGVNIDGNTRFNGFDIIEANSNDLCMFPDGYFDCVLSNATIEHDPFFWKTCSEVNRVLRAGGVAVIGAPGFTTETSLEALGIQVPFPEDTMRSWARSTLTFRIHGAPDDYYRFSPSAFRDIIFAGFSDVTLKCLMVPPRIIGYGFKQSR